MILDPVTLSKDATVRDAKAMMAEFRIGGIPVLMKIKSSLVLLPIVICALRRITIVSLMRLTKENLVTTEPNGTMEEAEAILQNKKKITSGRPENKLVGLITYRDITKIKIKPNANKDKYGRLRVAAAVVTNDIVERVGALTRVA